jgi:hypothetical protein
VAELGAAATRSKQGANNRPKHLDVRCLSSFRPCYPQRQRCCSHSYTRACRLDTALCWGFHGEWELLLKTTTTVPMSPSTQMCLAMSISYIYTYLRPLLRSSSRVLVSACPGDFVMLPPANALCLYLSRWFCNAASCKYSLSSKFHTCVPLCLSELSHIARRVL